MAPRRSIIRLALLGGLCLIALAGTGKAQQYRDGEFIELRRDSVRTGLFFAITVNADTLELWAASRRIIDSLIAARAGSVVQQSEIVITATVNFNNAASGNDSTDLFINGTNYETFGVPYDLYLDRFTFRTSEPDSRQPSTFRSDLPSVSVDSAFLFRVSRNASFSSGTRAALTVYKVSRSAGLSLAGSTAGVFYDMVRFDEAVLPSPGTSTVLLLTITMKKIR